VIPRSVGPTQIAVSPVTSRTAGTVAGVLLPLGAFAALAVVVTSGGGIAWDTEALGFAERHYQQALVDWLDGILTGSLGLIVVVAVVAVALLLKARKRRSALFWAMAIGGVLALDLPLKYAFRRPALGGTEGSYSFPSGNAMVSGALLLALVLSSSPRWRKWALVVGVPVIIAYGVALVYAWWHYPSDVVAGWCLAGAWVFCLWLMLHRRAEGR
jgi:membrane-associated phospholipid phosphatase